MICEKARLRIIEKLTVKEKKSAKKEQLTCVFVPNVERIFTKRY